ncbi:MAG: hypothetical protein AB7V32_08995 [Candidatus Berkiella sp.]
MVDNINDDSNEPNENEEEFGEEFDFESEPHDDALAPDSESGEEIQEMAPAPKSKSVMLPLIIGIAVLGFIGWKAFTMLSAPKQQAKGGPKVEQLQTQTAEIEVQAPTTGPTTTAEPTQPKSAVPNLYEAEQMAKQAVSDEKITAILQKKIDEQFATQKQQIETSQKDAAAAAQSAANASKSVNELQQQVTTLSATVQDLAAQMKAMKDAQLAELARQAAREAKAKPKPKTKISSKADAFTNPSISVHAIIPGRAWLRTVDGKTITVTEGDSIGEYGKVLKIDAPNGLVITTSGVTLR